MNLRQLESILLSEDDTSRDKIKPLLEVSYKETLSQIFNIFYDKVLSGPSIDIEIMLNNIENILLNEDIKNNKIIISKIKHIIYRLSSLKVDQNTELKCIKYRLLDIIRKINNKKDKIEKINIYNAYYSIIFRDRDLNILELILKEEKNILRVKDSRGNDIFYNVIDHYSQLDEESVSDIEYFHDVIMLFIRLEEDVFVKNIKNYYKLLERDFCKNKSHVQEISRQLYGFSEVDINKLKRKYDISTKIHDEVIKELETFKVTSDGREYIDAPFITIDDEKATCLDDALCMVENKDGSYTFYVAITDIPSIIPYHSRTFYDALRKNETLYLCDGQIDLYHPTISHNIASLIEGEKRNTIIYKFIVDPYFNIDIDSLEIIKGVIKNSNRLSYGMVNKQQNITPLECKMIENMYFLAVKLKRLNDKKDKYRELENLIKKDATYHHSLFSNKSISANIVEESMLLVNSSTPRYFSKNGFIYNYRNHKLPSDRGINHEIERLLLMGQSNIEKSEYDKIISSIKDMYLNAYYSTENRGHEGLGYDFYSHSTSPARRFSDSFNQYLTYFQVFNTIQSDRDYYELEEISKEVVKYMNERKRDNSKFESEYNYIVTKVRTLKR